MTTIGPIGSSVGSAHLEVLKRAEHALQTEKPDTAFTERMTNALRMWRMRKRSRWS